MTKHRILIIDDELDKAKRSDTEPRRRHYEKLSSRFHVDFVTSASEIQSTDRLNGVHFVLLDFFLEEWKTTAGEVIEFIPDHIPIGLVSAQWDQEFAEMRTIVSDHRKQIVKLVLWSDIETDDRASFDLLIANIQHQIQLEFGFSELVLADDEPIRILHLSDVQFGSARPATLGVDSNIMAQRVRQYWQGASPAFIMMTGDIAQTGMPSEFDQARDWLNDLAYQLDPNWSSSRLFVVPGNHDICWNLGLSYRVSPGTDKLLAAEKARSTELKDFAFAPYQRFVNSMLGTHKNRSALDCWISEEFLNYGIIISGINSCEELDSNSKETLKLQDRTLTKLVRGLTNSYSHFEGMDAVPLLINLIHHPVCEGEERVDNPEDFFRMAGMLPGTLVNLCGHVHDDDGFLMDKGDVSILEITASTATQPEAARPADSSRGFNLITLNRSQGRIGSLKIASCKFDKSGLAVLSDRVYERSGSGHFSTERR